MIALGDRKSNASMEEEEEIHSCPGNMFLDRVVERNIALIKADASKYPAVRTNVLTSSGSMS